MTEQLKPKTRIVYLNKDTASTPFEDLLTLEERNVFVDGITQSDFENILDEGWAYDPKPEFEKTAKYFLSLSKEERVIFATAASMTFAHQEAAKPFELLVDQVGFGDLNLYTPETVEFEPGEE